MGDIVKRLDAEIERERQTRGDYLDYGQPDPLLVEARNCIAELEAGTDKMANALRFYADTASYCKLFTPQLKEGDPCGFAPVLQDDGQQARAALAEWEAGK